MKASKGDKSFKLFHSIGFELLAFYLSVSIVVLMVGTLLVYNSTINFLQKRSEEYILEQFKQAEYNIQNLADEMDNIASLLMVDKDTQQLLQAGRTDDSYESITMQIDVMDKMNEDINIYKKINSIYFFTQSGGFGTSQIRTVRFPDDSSHSFYTSGLFDKAIQAFPKLVWNADLTEEWFRSGSLSGNYVVSFAKAARPLDSPRLTSVIVLNVAESDICGTYSRFVTSASDKMYIMDSNGVILSSIDKSDIGKKGPFIPTSDSISFTSDNGKSKELVVYDKLKETDWFIVRETPLGIFESDKIVFRSIALVVFLISILLIVAASVFSMKRITKPLGSLTARMNDIGKGNWGITIDNIPQNELGLVTTKFNEMSVNIRELMERNAEVEREKNELEMEALKYQINPHFLFNTLNMIKWMAAIVKAENILDSTTALINILHPLYSDFDSMWALADEIKCLENYIVIMNGRFKYKILFRFDVPGSLLNYRIIKFILQPVVENSITHGTGEQNGQIEISIRATETDSDIAIEVRDNGVGMPEGTLNDLRRSLDRSMQANRREKHKSIGLCNVNRRIKLNYGDQYGVRIDSHVGEGTAVTIRLPKILQ